MDTEGNQLRKDLAQLNSKKARPIDLKEDAKLRHQAMIMLEEVKKPIKYEPFNKAKDTRTLPQVKPPSSHQGKRPVMTQ